MEITLTRSEIKFAKNQQQEQVKFQNQHRDYLNVKIKPKMQSRNALNANHSTGSRQGESPLTSSRTSFGNLMQTQPLKTEFQNSNLSSKNSVEIEISPVSCADSETEEADVRVFLQETFY
jgi:hypothetical protein